MGLDGCGESIRRKGWQGETDLQSEARNPCLLYCKRIAKQIRFRLRVDLLSWFEPF
jgi:hypothetical protein